MQNAKQRQSTVHCQLWLAPNAAFFGFGCVPSAVKMVQYAATTKQLANQKRRSCRSNKVHWTATLSLADDLLFFRPCHCLSFNENAAVAGEAGVALAATATLLALLVWSIINTSGPLLLPLSSIVAKAFGPAPAVSPQKTYRVSGSGSHLAGKSFGHPMQSGGLLVV